MPFFRFGAVAGGLLLGSLCQGQPSQPRMKPIPLPPLQRPTATIQKAALPNGATGAFPKHDGDVFHVNLPGGEPRMSAELARRAVEQIAGAFGWQGTAQDLRLVREEHQGQQVDTFEQIFQGVPIEQAQVKAVYQPGRGLIAVTGRVFAKVQPSNKARLSETQAAELARTYAARYTKLTGRETPKPELVLLPYADTMKFAWRIEVTAEEGGYRLWLDAQTKSMLQLDPLFSSGS